MTIGRREQIISGRTEPGHDSHDGVTVLHFASDQIFAAGFSTAMTVYATGAGTPKHVHDVSEAMTVLEGAARVVVSNREYMMWPYDCIHVPAGAAHLVTNAGPGALKVHSAFGSASPIHKALSEDVRAVAPEAGASQSETVLRFPECPVYELSPGALFRDLFARRLGTVGICGGYGVFDPGSSLPCHTHKYDESITIVSGKATCLVRGKRYTLDGYDTAFVPEGEPHRFINESDAPMAMIWVYAGDEPDRQIVEAGYCSGELVWLEQSPQRNTLSDTVA